MLQHLKAFDTDSRSPQHFIFRLKGLTQIMMRQTWNLLQRCTESRILQQSG